HYVPVKLTFLGTRGEIEARTRRHHMHTSLLVSYRRAKVMIDCGQDWLGKFDRLQPDAIVLTHAHPDHAWGLKNGAPCPVHAPDLVFIRDRAAALRGVKIYIGDGATLTRSFIRRRGKSLIGHSPVRTQLTWCGKEGVPRAVITHCGSEIVKGDERKIGAQLREMAAERGIEACIAHDGMELIWH